MSDAFRDFCSSLESPATRLVEVTPDDSQDLPFATRAIAVGQAGAVKVTTIAGDTGIFYLAAGVPFPIRVRRIWTTGTTATGLVGLA